MDETSTPHSITYYQLQYKHTSASMKHQTKNPTQITPIVKTCRLVGVLLLLLSPRPIQADYEYTQSKVGYSPSSSNQYYEGQQQQQTRDQQNPCESEWIFLCRGIQGIRVVNCREYKPSDTHTDYVTRLRPAHACPINNVRVLIPPPGPLLKCVDWRVWSNKSVYPYNVRL